MSTRQCFKDILKLLDTGKASSSEPWSSNITRVYCDNCTLGQNEKSNMYGTGRKKSWREWMYLGTCLTSGKCDEPKWLTTHVRKDLPVQTEDNRTNGKSGKGWELA